MKKSKSKTYRIIKCGHCNKKFNESHGLQKYCSKECVKEVRKEILKRYFQSDKGKTYRKEYAQLNRGKEIIKKSKKINEQSNKGKETIKKYNQSDKRKETLKRYRKTDKRKEVLKKYNQSDTRKKYVQSDKYKSKLTKYKQSDQGRKSAKKSNKKYGQSDKGKDTSKRIFEKRRKTDLIFKLILTCRSRLTKILKLKNMKKTNTTFAMIGCTPKFLKEYLEKQFEPWMNWKNHTRKGWHIDHITPLSSAKTPKALEKLMHYTNLKPLRGTENIKKGNRII